MSFAELHFKITTVTSFACVLDFKTMGKCQVYYHIFLKTFCINKVVTNIALPQILGHYADPMILFLPFNFTEMLGVLSFSTFRSTCTFEAASIFQRYHTQRH